MAKRRRRHPRRVHLVFCDGSVLGVFRAKEQARSAAKLRSRGSMLDLECVVVSYVRAES